MSFSSLILLSSAIQWYCSFYKGHVLNFRISISLKMYFIFQWASASPKYHALNKKLKWNFFTELTLIGLYSLVLILVHLAFQVVKKIHVVINSLVSYFMARNIKIKSSQVMWYCHTCDIKGNGHYTNCEIVYLVWNMTTGFQYWFLFLDERSIMVFM